MQTIDRLQKDLQEGKERWRHLHHERKTLKHRISAPGQSILPSMPAPTPTRSPLQATKLAKSAIQIEPFADIKGKSQPPARVRQDSDLSMQSQNTLHHQMVHRSRHSRCNQHCAAPYRKPISAFQHHEVVSFSFLTKYMTSQKIRSFSQFNHQELQQAFLMCQTETAQRLNVPESEICWFLMWSCGVCAQHHLCTSFSALSGACKLSLMVANMTMISECIFLVMEHEHLSKTADPFCKLPSHPILGAAAPPLPPRPQLPDAAVLAATYVRCGVNDLVQMDVAMRRIMRPVVCKFKGLLPQGKWLTVCIQIMGIAQRVVDALRSAPGNESQESCKHATEETTDQVTQCSSEV
jgi:hypothetical protein